MTRTFKISEKLTEGKKVIALHLQTLRGQMKFLLM
jgi:hypothetical protein